MQDTDPLHDYVETVMLEVMAVLWANGQTKLHVGALMRLLGVPESAAAKHDDERIEIDESFDQQGTRRGHNPLMSIPTHRAVEPLYIVILRKNPQAESMLKTWIRDNRIEHTVVNGNRMMIHHQSAFDRFLITWTHPWDSVTVWDTWNRRHIYI